MRRRLLRTESARLGALAGGIIPILAGCLFVLAVTAFEPVAFAQDKKASPSPSPSPAPSLPPKPAASPGPSPAPKPNGPTAVNCIIELQYAAGSVQAKANGEIHGSALAVAVQNKKDNKETENDAAVVDEQHDFASAFDALSEDKKKCCKKIDILSHGTTQGGIRLPYTQHITDEQRGNTTPDEIADSDLAAVGGKPQDPNAGTALGRELLRDFAKRIKAALCPPPPGATTGRVTFHGCYTAQPGFNIAQEVAAMNHVPTAGYEGECEFYKDKDHPNAPGAVPTGKLVKYDENGNEVSLAIPGVSGQQNQEYATRTPVLPRTPVGDNLSYTIPVATDSIEWCTFGSAQAVATVLIPTDSNGNRIADAAPGDAATTTEPTPTMTERPKQVTPRPLASLRSRVRPAPTMPVADNPPSASTPEQPKATKQTLPATPVTPSMALSTRSPSAGDQQAPTPPEGNRPASKQPTASTPEQPQMTDQVPPATDNAPQTADRLRTPDQVTIDFNEKASVKEVAENLQVATAEPSAALKLKSVTPDLPGRGDKNVQDTGSDKGPATGRMGVDGHVRITIDDPEALGLASGPGSATHFRADIDLPEHSGFIAETMGKPVDPAALASALPAGVKATIDTVRVGGRSDTRVGLDWPRSQKVDPAALAASIGRAIGAKVAADTCRRTKPAPTAGMRPLSSDAVSGALPATIIKLRRTIEVGRTR